MTVAMRFSMVNWIQAQGSGMHQAPPPLRPDVARGLAQAYNGLTMRWRRATLQATRSTRREALTALRRILLAAPSALLLAAGCGKEPSSEKAEIPLPEMPPRLDPVESGTYILSVTIDLEGGRKIRQRHACSVQVRGAEMVIRIERSKSPPLVGVLAEGRLVVQPGEAPDSYGMKGQVVGPGKLEGKILDRPSPEGVRIIEGMWSLERVK